MQVCVIQMGGTIDKTYPQVPNSYGFEIESTQSIDILSRWKDAGDFHFHTISQKDSQDLDDQDRADLVDYLRRSSYDGYIITHGTDTMGKTGTYVREKLSNFTRPIALTGSRLPACIVNSDAAMNLGMSVGVIKTTSAGVFIVLDGKVSEVKSLH